MGELGLRSGEFGGVGVRVIGSGDWVGREWDQGVWGRRARVGEVKAIALGLGSLGVAVRVFGVREVGFRRVGIEWVGVGGAGVQELGLKGWKSWG